MSKRADLYIIKFCRPISSLNGVSDKSHHLCSHAISWITGGCVWLEDKEEEEVSPFIVNLEKSLEVLTVEMEAMEVMSF